MSIPFEILAGKRKVYYPDKIENGGFEVAGSGYTFSGWPTENLGTGGQIIDETTDIYAGVHALKLVRGSTSQPYVRSIAYAVIPGKTYFLDFFSHGGGSGVPYYHVYNKTASNFIINGAYIPSWSDGVYRRHVRPVLIPAGCYEIYLFLVAGSTTGNEAYFDNVKFYPVEAKNIFADNFARANGELYQSPTGQPYFRKTNTGGLGEMAIINGRMDVPNTGVAGAGYLYVELPATPKTVSANVIFKDDGATENDLHSIACISISNNYYNCQLFKNLVHVYISPKNYHVDTGDAGSFTALANGDIDLSPNVEYRFSYDISGTTLTLHIPTIAEPVVVTDASINTHAGKYAYYEIYKGVDDCKTPTYSYIGATWL